MKLPLENNMRPWKDLFLLIIEHTIKFHWNPLVIMVSVQNDKSFARNKQIFSYTEIFQVVALLFEKFDVFRWEKI